MIAHGWSQGATSVHSVFVAHALAAAFNNADAVRVRARQAVQRL